MTPADLASHLIVEFCFPAIIGGEQKRVPLEGVELTELMRIKLGLPPGGRAVRYVADKTAVYFDMTGGEAQVFFQHREAAAAADIVENAVRARFPALRYTGDGGVPPYHRRAFECVLPNGKAAILEIYHPYEDAGNTVLNFAARVTALAKSSRSVA